MTVLNSTNYEHPLLRCVDKTGVKLLGNLQIFGTKHKKMQIYLKWLKYRLKINLSSFTYYFHTVIMVSKLKK